MGWTWDSYVREALAAIQQRDAGRFTAGNIDAAVTFARSQLFERAFPIDADFVLLCRLAPISYPLAKRGPGILGFLMF